MTSPVPFEAAQAAPFITAVRSRAPLVHCITNDVVQAFTANVLLAIGASPAMVVAEEEAGGFAVLADALLVNVGTITAMSARSMFLAADSAREHGTPWVLDPVAVGGLPYRAGVVNDLLRSRPSAIRGNASEILFLSGRTTAAKGPDSREPASLAHEAAGELAIRHQCIVAVTGEVDFITDGENSFAVQGGHANLTRVTGTGCALSAMTAAFLGSCGETARLAAAASACLMMKAAGRKAGAHPGLGSFGVAVLDALSL